MDSSESGKILVVDDMKTNITILINTLGPGYDISIAMNGESALAIAASQKPDLILLDVLMPGMNGYEVCQQLKTREETKDIPVIFITALSEDDNEAEGLKMGAVDYISKPFNPSLVKARVQNHLELKRYRDDLETQVSERTKELAMAKEATIQSLAFLAEFRDVETGSHIQRTKLFVKIIADRLSREEAYRKQLDRNIIDLLQLSAPLHDIGKIGIPDTILLKPGKLTYEEFEEMKKHTIYGADALRKTESILGGTSFLNIARIIAEFHHEKWDGSGYPYGLRSKEIPIFARIMAIADVYDALISLRPYKAAMSHEEARETIFEGANTHFDPLLVEIFRELEGEFKRITAHYID